MDSRLIDGLIQNLERGGHLNESEISAVAAGIEDYLESRDELLNALKAYNNAEIEDKKQDLVFDLYFEIEFHLLPHLNDIATNLKKSANP